jgi:single-strand DNA-binding protein
VVNFCIAVNRIYKRGNGERVKEVAFVPCEAWDSGAEAIANRFRKGDKVLVEGPIRTDSWTNSEGEARQQLRCRVEHFHPMETGRRREDDEDDRDEAA